MIQQPWQLQIRGSGAVALFFIARLVISAPDQHPTLSDPRGDSLATSAATSTAQKQVASPDAPSRIAKEYAGTNQCFTCHRPQTDTWSETKHAHSFTHVPKKYQSDPACLKCHVTGFGHASGYVAGTDKDLLMVGCEACHGPGAQHIDAAKRFVMANIGEEATIEKEMRETITKMPSDSVCIACHITQAHQSHPAYEGQRSLKSANGADLQCNPTLPVANRTMSMVVGQGNSPHYNVKTCGGCHYDAYKNWRVGKHSDLFAILPVKYQNDQSCTSCHQNATSLAKEPIERTDARHNQVGVLCESCHGPALEHVRFNRQFISGPPLGPKFEEAARHSIRKGKPDNTCLKCHVSHSHKEHPEFDATR